MRLNLHNRTIRVGYNNINLLKSDPKELPFTRIDSRRIFGIEPILIATFANYFNFSVELIDCKGVYGVKNPNGTWSGMIGMISLKEIDIGIGGYIITYERHLVVDHLYPHWIDELSYATSLPAKQISFDLLLKPFTWEIWLCIFASFLFLFLFNTIRFALSCWDSSNLKQNDQSQRKNEKCSMQNNSNIIWISFCLLLQQPSHWLRSLDLTLKIFIVFWMISVFLLAQIYGGRLYSILTIPSQYTIDSILKLADACRSKKMVSLIQANTSFYEIFSSSSLCTFQAIWNSMKLIMTIDDGIELMTSQTRQQYAILGSRSSLEYFRLNLGRNSFYTPPDNDDSSFYPALITLPLQNQFKYKKEFNHLVFLLQSHGFINHWIDQQMYHVKRIHVIPDELDDKLKPPWSEKDHNQEGLDKELVLGRKKANHHAEPFDMNHMESIFYLYLICITFSFIIFIIELCNFYRKFSNQNHPGIFSNIPI
ncbi:Glutamate receptor delta-1 subunit precursor (GluR delta-1)-like protein [Sarcoptes scabiei]|uniref:Glutamate receptor delta-1 subunit (GluR delta-1)-like protein n=1 Tax=Sarcoptes scabiei TaxID=52283 RepID=A0A131ZW33_SARSC|nr:Glutamate receptor delta-1 subunit precursor (GluR delta-1)-like protein [Sarcoptes scabiei]